MAFFKLNEINSDCEIVHVYAGISQKDLNRLIDNELRKKGYTLIEGSMGNGIYEKGSRIKKMIFRTFVGYYKLGVSTDIDKSCGVRLFVTNEIPRKSQNKRFKREMELIDLELRLI